MNPPILKVPRPFGDPLEVYRCLTDQTLHTNRSLSTGRCAGHRLAQPVVLSDWEVLKVWARVVE